MNSGYVETASYDQTTDLRKVGLQVNGSGQAPNSVSDINSTSNGLWAYSYWTPYTGFNGSGAVWYIKV